MSSTSPNMPHFIEDTAVMIEQADAVASRGDDEPIRTKNRRIRYLELHPDYFEDPGLELADVLLFDRMVRRFQTAEEREKEGRLKGYSGVLEADLLRSEAKIDALHRPHPGSSMIVTRAADGSISGVEQDEEDRALNKSDGFARWKDVMGSRFVRGEDDDFDYTTVDNNEDLDDRAEQDRQQLEEYLQGEQPEFVGQGAPSGETGVQDF